MSTNQTFYGLGRRKQSTAQVQIKLGSGKITINGKEATSYFQNNKTYLTKITLPFNVLGLTNTFDVQVKASGGGLTGQTDATCLGIARALNQCDMANRATLKSEGLMKRDARIKERKKYGLKKARKASQFSNR
jgi:small subunit ribosomal protein S9